VRTVSLLLQVAESVGELHALEQLNDHLGVENAAQTWDIDCLFLLEGEEHVSVLLVLVLLEGDLGHFHQEVNEHLEGEEPSRD